MYLQALAAMAANVIGMKRATAGEPILATRLRRSTARNLRYLQKRKLIAPIDGRNIVVCRSLRYVDVLGKFRCENVPTHGV